MKEKVCICGVFFLNRIRNVLFCKQNMAIYGTAFLFTKTSLLCFTYKFC